jgi:predicted dehydrogenase
MVRLGLIGCGEHAEIGHAIPLARYKAANPDAVILAAACDLNLAKAQRFCSDYGFARAHQDANEMLARESLDGVIAVVPVERIAAVGADLLKRGTPCVIEKPLGSSPEEIEQLVTAARVSKTPHMVSVNRRFMPSLNRAVAWTQKIGPLRYVRATMARHARTESDFLWTTGVHAVDALRYIAGAISSAEIATIGEGKTGWFGIDIRFSYGAAARVDLVPTAGVVEEVYELAGDSFRATVTSPFGESRGWRGFQAGKLVVEEFESQPADVISGFYHEAAEFIEAVSSGRSPRPSIEEVAPSVELCFDLMKRAYS